jgi:hypothetical protein
MEFCEHFDGRLKWKNRGSWNRLFLDFFSAKAEALGYFHTANYMSIDQVWWSEVNDIELALQHEAHVRNVPLLFVRKDRYPQEVRQLLDIKALRKILISYVSEADETTLINNFVEWLKSHRLRITSPSTEEYMIVIGRSVPRAQQRALLFRAYTFYYYGGQKEPPVERYLRPHNTAS